MDIELGAPFDAAAYITDEETQIELLNDAFATGDRAYIAHALGTVARARGGVSKLAGEAGMGRQALHRALDKGGNPTLETLLKVLGSMDIRLRAEPGAKAA